LLYQAGRKGTLGDILNVSDPFGAPENLFRMASIGLSYLSAIVDELVDGQVDILRYPTVVFLTSSRVSSNMQ
jgi:hypothetical protein